MQNAVIALSLAMAAPRADSTHRAAFTVTIDSARRELTFEYRVPADTAAPAHHDHGGGAHAGHTLRMNRFRSPITGWFRGAQVEIEDPSGQPVPQSVLHHINLLNLSRRQLIHPGVERMWAAGPETAPTVLPAGVGMPVSDTMTLGVMVAYSTAAMRPGSLIRLRLAWTPGNTVPRPVDIFPLPIDVNYRVAESAAYDLPAGRSTRSFEFVMPIAGRMLGAGGHMHDYGESLVLEDLDRGRVVLELKPRKDAAGKVTGVSREVFGVLGAGRKLEAGRRYRLTATYDNPTGTPIPLGGMGELGIGFTPNDASAWPRLDVDDELIARDLEGLASYERH